MNDQARKDAMFERYGQPVKIDTAAALRLAGLRSEIHPKDAFACRYSSVEAAEAFAHANREYHGHGVFGPYETGDGPVNVVDLRRPEYAPWPPALPDDHTGVVPEEHRQDGHYRDDSGAVHCPQEWHDHTEGGEHHCDDPRCSLLKAFRCPHMHLYGGCPLRYEPVLPVDATGVRQVYGGCAPGCDFAVTGYHARRGGRVLCEVAPRDVGAR